MIKRSTTQFGFYRDVKSNVCRSCWIVLSTLLIASHAAPSAVAETRRQELLDQEPLAQCSVRTIASNAQREAMPQSVALARVQTVAEDPLSLYARLIDGQWYIPATVDRNDPWVRILVLGPVRPVLVDIAVEIDGKPYRQAREEWIDLLLHQARKESLIQDALSTTTPNPPESVTDQLDNLNSAESEETALAEDAADDKLPIVKVQSRQAPAVVNRLINYLASGGAEEDRAEIRWLLAEWAGGPALLALGPAYSWQRAQIAPLWQRLDSDQDKKLSLDEMSQAAGRLKNCDVDEDDVVDLEELVRGNRYSSPYTRAMNHSLIVELHEGTDWDVLRKELVELYDNAGGEAGKLVSSENSTIKHRVQLGDASLTASELSELLYEPADIAYRVSLGPEDGTVSLLDAGGSEAADLVHASDQVITVELEGGYLELSAATGPAETLDVRRTQLAVGAVVDGSPLFRLLDQDNNRRLTLREQRRLEDCLASCDRNGDGQIDNAELPTAIRLTVTLGPHAHEVLQMPTAASRQIEGKEQIKAPAWFVDMDRNRDGDLARNEFLGTSEQFGQLDRDGDGLIGKQEAQETTTSGE